MRKLRYILIPLLVIILCAPVRSQVTKDYSVLLTATVDTITPKITLHWPGRAAATSHTVHRKTKNAVTWGVALATLSGTDTVFTDLNVVMDSCYEYKVTENAPPISATGYLCAAIKLHPAGHRGTLIMIVDSTFTDSLSMEINRLMKDISGDGWAILRHDVGRTDSVTHVKSLIQADYNNAFPDVKALLLLGHVPVPFSGDFNPDAHPDHKGAWPADAYYADIDGIYTDFSVFDTAASRPENRNIPGDGKFDQSYIPTDVELQTGRIDMWNMPAFGLPEQELLRRYLNKNHLFRNKQIVVEPRGLIDDNFGAFSGEAFATGGWKNFPPLVGADSIHELDLFTTLTQKNYLWTYACGGGWYQGAGGVGSTADFVNDSVQTIFTMLFGSYFGDWSSQDNFLRAPLASSGTALTSCWSGRPHWVFHHMGTGENIGYQAKLSANNTGTYTGNYSTHCMHIALMGDPTLRMHVVEPVSGLILNNNSNLIGMNWDPPAENVAGYHVFRSGTEFGRYTRISTDIVSGTAYTDSTPQHGQNYYMVRAVKLQQSPSGSYYNMSTGVTASVSVDLSGMYDKTSELKVITAWPNPCRDKLYIKVNSAYTGQAMAELNDICGSVKQKQQLYLNSGENLFWFEMSSEASGIYFVCLRTPQGVIHIRAEHLQ